MTNPDGWDELWMDDKVDFVVSYDDLSYQDIACAHEDDEECHERDSERAYREGITCISSSYRDPATSERKFANSVGGFIGNDWEGSGYDEDVKQSAIDAYSKALAKFQQRERVKMLVSLGAGQ